MAINILFAGFGGQGVLFAGKIAAYTGLLDDKHVTWLPSYGPEMRGGTANCSVCLSDDPIGCPMVDRPDLLVAMNGPSYDKFLGNVAPGGKVIADSSLISEITAKDGIEQYPIPATELAETNELSGLSNMICLGLALRVTGFTGEHVLIEAISNAVSSAKVHLVEKNEKAFRIGFDYEKQ